MTASEALLHCLDPIPEATRVTNGQVVPAWDVIDDDDWRARLSHGERCLLWAALQLWNKGGRDLKIDLGDLMAHCDAENRHRFLEAVAMVHDEDLLVMHRPTEAAVRIAEHRGDRKYLED